LEVFSSKLRLAWPLMILPLVGFSWTCYFDLAAGR
jgi:hypothetical protein